MARKICLRQVILVIAPPGNHLLLIYLCNFLSAYLAWRCAVLLASLECLLLFYMLGFSIHFHTLLLLR
jgi:hypothetical protein